MKFNVVFGFKEFNTAFANVMYGVITPKAALSSDRMLKFQP